MPLDPAKLKSARESRGLSQRALAEAAGITQPHVVMLEAGRRNNPAVETVEKLAKALRVPLAKLLA